jgi:hypothetical protein
MAIAFDAASNAAAASTGSTLTWSHTVGAALSNGVLIVGFFSTIGDLPDGVTYGGVAMTRIPGSPGSFGNNTPTFYILLNPPAGAHNVVATDAGNSGSMTGYAASYSGVNQSTTVDAYGNGNTGGTAGAVTAPLSTVAVGAWIVSAAYVQATSPTMVAGAGLTSRAGPLAATATRTTRLADSNGTVATGAHSVAWTAGGSSFNTWAIEAFSLAPSTSSTAALAGSIAGSAAVAGTLTKPGVGLAGSIAGSAGVAGALTQAPPGATLAGPIAARATVAGALTQAPAGAVLAGSIAGSSSAAAQLAGVAILSGSIAGSAAVAGALTLPARAALAGSIAGSAAVAGALTISAGLAGAIAGTSTSSGALTTSAALVGAIAGTSTSSATLHVRAGLAGAIAGAASVSGSLTIDAGGPLPVYVDFRGTIFYANGTTGAGPWRSIVCDVFGLGWQRGSSEYRGIFGIPDASTADLYLYDPGLTLDPTNTAGPWYGEIDVGAELRIYMGQPGPIADVMNFYGRIGSISHELRPPPDPALDPVPVAHLVAADPQGRMPGVELPATGSFVEVEETSSARIARMLTFAQVPGPHSIEAGGAILYGAGAHFATTDAWSAVVDVLQNELGSAEWVPGAVSGGTTGSTLRTHVRSTVWPASPPATVLDLGCHALAIPLYSATPTVVVNTVRNEVFAGRGHGLDTAPVQNDDTVSQAKYLLRPTTKTDLLFRDAADRDAWETAVLNHAAYPLQSWRLETRPDRLAQVSAIEAVPLYVGWARVTTEGYGPDMDRPMRVVGVSWSVDASGSAVCEITAGVDTGIPIPRPLP